MEFDIQSCFNEDKNCWEIKASGEIDIFNSNGFKDSINVLIEKKQADLIIDCISLRYIDSTALAALVSILKKVKNYGCTIKLRNVSPNMTRLLKITSLDNEFVIEGEGNAEAK